MTTGGYIIAAIIAASGAVLGGLLSFIGARRGSKDLKENQDALLKAQKLQADENRRQQNLEKLLAGYQAMTAAIHNFPELPEPPAPVKVYMQIVEAIYAWSKDIVQARATIVLFAPDLLYKDIGKWSSLAQDDARTMVEFLLEMGRVASALKVIDVPAKSLDEGHQLYMVIKLLKSADSYSERVGNSLSELLDVIRRDTQRATDV